VPMGGTSTAVRAVQEAAGLSCASADNTGRTRLISRGRRRSVRHSSPEPVQIGGRPHLIDWRLGHLPSVLKKMARAARRMAGLGLDVESRRHFRRSVRLAKHADGRK